MSGFILETLPPADAKNYWSSLQENHLCFQLGDKPFQYGHPLTISPALATELRLHATNASQHILKRIRQSGGVTHWLNTRAMSLDGHSISNPAINRQLQDRFDHGQMLPLSSDCIYATSTPESQPSWIPPEVQSLWSYGPWIAHQARCGGQHGSNLAVDHLMALKASSTGDNPITVIDMNPNGPTKFDLLSSSQALGNPNCIPVTPQQIEQRGSEFYAPYVHGQPPQKIFGVVCRLYGADFVTLQQSTSLEQRKTFKRFLKASHLTWLMHPAWNELLTKEDLPDLQQQSFTEQPNVHYVPTYGPGQTAPAGDYHRKPLGGVAGQQIQKLNLTKPEVVPPGHIYQQTFHPSPVSIGSEHADPRLRNANVEICFMTYPFSPSPLRGQFLARVAPHQRANGDYTQTNLGHIMASIWESPEVTLQTHQNLPMGWCTVNQTPST